MQAEDDIVDLTSPECVEYEACPVCGKSFPLQELQSHCITHFPTDDNRDTNSVECPICHQHVPFTELESHELAHTLEEPNTGLSINPEDSSDEGNINDAELERLYFEQLRAQYGFQAPQRPGICFICKESNHWARDCPQNPDKIAAQKRIIPQPTASAIIAASQKDDQYNNTPSSTALPSVIELLAKCLRNQYIQQQPKRQPQKGRKRKQVKALLAGPALGHFNSIRYDAGWGCGYRNMQMQASYILQSRPEHAAALFGNLNYVPDLPTIQAWIECAWNAGFDPQGAEQLESSLQASRKWVGTTEAAVLFHYFGFDAHIVDFGVPAGQGYRQRPNVVVVEEVTASKNNNPSQAVAVSSSLSEVHQRVACDGCGMLPISGPRYKSQKVDDVDLCVTCRESGKYDESFGPFLRMLATGVQQSTTVPPAAPIDGGKNTATNNNNNGTTKKKQETTRVGKMVCRWVWDYFSSQQEAIDPKLASKDGRGGSAAGGSLHQQDVKRQRMVDGDDTEDSVVVTGKSPLYFQHQGHSRTIIGIERIVHVNGEEEYTLFILDPGHDRNAVYNALASGTNWQKHLKRGAHTLRHDQYQLLYISDAAVRHPGSEAYEKGKKLNPSERYSVS